MTAGNKAEKRSAREELERSDAETEASIEWWRDYRRRRDEHDEVMSWYDDYGQQRGPSQYWGRL